MIVHGSKHFSRSELQCSCCGKSSMEAEFLERLEMLREVIARPLIVSSGYRCADYNEKISKSGRTGPHTTGRAVDLLVSGEGAFQVVQVATGLAGFTGIGVKQKGDWGSRFIHLDDLDGSNRPRIWSY